MRIVVPLAGPGFILDGGTLKADIEVEGVPLLRCALNARPWSRSVSGHNYSFVMLDTLETRAFAASSLRNWYPGSSITYISCYSRGAALSAMAGLATGVDVGEPIIVDLADILYQSTLDPVALFEKNPDCGGIALTFQSDNPAYSYLSLNSSGFFEQAAEKRVIANNASAGTYIFRDMATYLRALAHGLDNYESQTYNDLFFVCPLFNGIKDQGKQVLLEPVTDVIDIKGDPR